MWLGTSFMTRLAGPAPDAQAGVASSSSGESGHSNHSVTIPIRSKTSAAARWALARAAGETSAKLYTRTPIRNGASLVSATALPLPAAKRIPRINPAFCVPLIDLTSIAVTVRSNFRQITRYLDAPALAWR